ncbi:MAG: tRNA-guanine transglycosylase, partial [Deltaproteobacteria bacterium]
MIRVSRDEPAPQAPFGFRLEGRSGRARAARFRTPHGVVHTPAFMVVGTQGAVRAMTPRQVRETGAEVMLANTYHLWVRPGERVIEKLGGLHAFTRWAGPMLTDSGGFQVYSLPQKEITDAGVC